MRRIALASVLAVLMAGLALAQQPANTEQGQAAPADSKSVHKEKPMVLMKTSMGDIKIELDMEKAPKTVENFLSYVDEGFYAGTIFHRVIDGFMIQGGGMTPDMNEKANHPPIPLESQNGLKNQRGTIAMARMTPPNTATSQFFINVVDNPALDYSKAKPGANGYAVFGRVVEGMDVVDKIKAVETTTKAPHQNVPVEPVVIESVERIKA